MRRYMGSGPGVKTRGFILVLPEPIRCIRAFCIYLKISVYLQAVVTVSNSCQFIKETYIITFQGLQ